jgi:hypothetical protein
MTPALAETLSAHIAAVGAVDAPLCLASVTSSGITPASLGMCAGRVASRSSPAGLNAVSATE